MSIMLIKKQKTYNEIFKFEVGSYFLTNIFNTVANKIVHLIIKKKKKANKLPSEVVENIHFIHCVNFSFVFRHLVFCMRCVQNVGKHCSLGGEGSLM